MMKKASRSLLQFRLIFIFTTIFLVALSAYGYFKTNQLIDSYKWAKHTNEVNLSLKNISSAFNEAINNRRAYLLTGDSTMIANRDLDYNTINHELNLLDSLTKDNPEQIENLKILHTAIDEKLAYLKVEDLKPIQIDTELKLLLIDGFNKSNKISEQINRMSLVEEQLLEVQTQKFTILAFITPLFIIILFLGALFILWISYSKMNSELHLSQQLRIKVEESNQELQKNNQEVTEGAEPFLKIFDNSPVAMTFAEIETNHVVYANKLFYNYFGYSEEEVIGHTTEELNLTSAEELERLIPIIMSHLEEDRPLEELKALSAEERAKLLLTLKEKMLKNGFEILYTRKNGETFFAIVFVEVIDIANKKYSLTTYQDITERKEAQKQLADEKAFAEMVIENDPSMIVVYDENLHIITWNKKSEEFSGLKKEEVLGKSTFDVFPEYNQEQWLSTFNSVLKDGKSLHFPIVEIEHKKNFVESWLMPLRNADQQIIGVLGITRDITEIIETNKKLEKLNTELIEGSERYLKIFDNNPVALAFAEIGSNKIIYANNLFYKQFGYTAEEVIGRSTDDLNIVSPEEKVRTQSILLKELQEERTIDELQALPEEELIELLMNLREKLFENGFEVIYTRKNGTTFYALVFYEIIEIGNKKYALASYQDITELKRSHLKLAEQRAFAESVIDNDPAMVLAYDENLKIIAWNKKTEENTGFKKEEVMGKNPYDIFPEYKNEKWESAFNLVLKEGKKIHYPKVPFKRMKGFGEFWLVPLLNADQHIIGILSITRDITETIEMTIALEQKNIELQKINKELESINYISSHDLQEPLRQIQVFGSRISDSELQHLSDAGQTYFKKIINAAKRMQNLINDLLVYSRTKTDARKFTIVNLNQIINEVIEEFGEIISDKHATVEVAELGDANIVPFQFRQMMYNLIGNALKFSKPDTPPHITIKNKKVKSNQVPGAYPIADTEYYQISITDNGIGFEPQYKDRIFEVFQRLHDKQKIAGTGIGLAIVKKIVENHNGNITATSELNKGATFDIYIPII